MQKCIYNLNTWMHLCTTSTWLTLSGWKRLADVMTAVISGSSLYHQGGGAQCRALPHSHQVIGWMRADKTKHTQELI